MGYQILVSLVDLGLVLVGALLIGLLLIGLPMWLADRWARRRQPAESDSITLLTDD